MKGTTVRKLYWNFENEERWLNEMAAKGQALLHYSWGTYRFEPSRPAEWIYRIELLPDVASKPASQEYLAFMADTGAQAVATYQGWVYFRKASVDGPFEVFSDLDSRIAHYKRVLILFASLFAALLPITIVNATNISRGEMTPVIFALALPVLILLLGVDALLAVQALRVSGKVRELEVRKRLFE